MSTLLVIQPLVRRHGRRAHPEVGLALHVGVAHVVGGLSGRTREHSCEEYEGREHRCDGTPAVLVRGP